jgi:hypothetical protein
VRALSVVTLAEVARLVIARLLDRYGLDLRLVAATEKIPGSYWGEREAGLKGDRLYARPDTPLHSVLHEAAHYVCMTPERRAGLDRDAGGDDAEESAVCYLQIVLADHAAGFGRARMMLDMDEWGYSFRLGSTRAWFESDAAEARTWLLDHALIDSQGHPTWKLRV